MKILVIRLAGLAEVLCSTPLIRCLHQQLNAEVHLLTASEYAHAAESNRFIQQLHLWYHNVDTLQALQAQAFTHVIDLQNNQDSKTITKNIGIKPLTRQRNVWQKLFANLGIDYTQKHIADVYFDNTALPGIYNDDKGLNFSVPKEWETKPSDIPAAHHMGYIVLHLHHVQPAEVEKLQNFCAQLPHPIIITGNHPEASIASQLASVDPVKVYNACGKFSFFETADLVQQSKLFMSFEPGFAMLAAALQKPVVLLHKQRQSIQPYYGKRPDNKKMHTTYVLGQKNEKGLTSLVTQFLHTGKFL
jgi:ADP-heptose:LPS heptosyltransferase